MSTIKTYSQMCKFATFEERFEYLKIGGEVGIETFGFERYLNQSFYHSVEWRNIRDKIILRDNGCDLGMEGYEVSDRAIIHHINPISKYDIVNHTDILLNPEYLVLVSKRTHDAIHYSDESLLHEAFVERTKNDTCPWRR